MEKPITDDNQREQAAQTERTTLLVDVDLWKQAKVAAAQNDETLTALFHRALRAELERLQAA
jgi:hypothetical protein